MKKQKLDTDRKFNKLERQIEKEFEKKKKISPSKQKLHRRSPYSNSINSFDFASSVFFSSHSPIYLSTWFLHRAITGFFSIWCRFAGNFFFFSKFVYLSVHHTYHLQEAKKKNIMNSVCSLIQTIYMCINAHSQLDMKTFIDHLAKRKKKKMMRSIERCEVKRNEKKIVQMSNRIH